MKKYPIRRSFVLVLLGLIFGGAAWAKVSAERAQTLPPGQQQLTLNVGNLERSYLLHIPPEYEKAKPLPLVIMLHGMGGTALLSQRETGWSAKADSENFIVVYPEESFTCLSMETRLGPSIVDDRVIGGFVAGYQFAMGTHDSERGL